MASKPKPKQPPKPAAKPRAPQSYKVVSTPLGDVPVVEGTPGYADAKGEAHPLPTGALPGFEKVNVPSTRPSYIKPKKETEAEITGGVEAKLAHDLANAKAWKDQAEEELKSANKEVDRLEKELAESMLARKVDLFRVPGLGTFSAKLKNYPSINDQNAFYAFLRKTKNEGLIKLTVHPQTLKGFVSELLADGKPLPPGVNNFPKPSILFTKAKK